LQSLPFVVDTYDVSIVVELLPPHFLSRQDTYKCSVPMIR